MGWFQSFRRALWNGWWSQPVNFDITGRFGLQRFTRLAEMWRTVDGDMGVLKLSRALVQAIEGDRI